MATQEISLLEEIEDRSGLSRGELRQLIDDVIREHFADESAGEYGVLCGIDLSLIGPLSGAKAQGESLNVTA